MIGGVSLLDLAQTLCLLALLGLAFIQHRFLIWLVSEMHRVKRVQLHFDNQLKSLERKTSGR
jgi:hypothetical protein